MLTKTDFLTYLDAPMHLWARVHDQLAEESPSLFAQHLMTQGQQVESLAYQYIQAFILAKYGRAELTWQHPYEDGKYQIRVDALIHDQKANAYDLYEIKSSTSVRKEHEMDITFQVLLLEDQIPMRHKYILYINNDYQLGETLDLEQFFTLKELSDKVEQRRETVDWAREAAYTITQLDSPHPGFACTKPQTCPCPSLCHPNLPNNPIFQIPYIGKKANQLQEMDILAIEDIPNDFNLNSKQKKHVQAVKSGQPIIDHLAIQKSLATLAYPLHFLDYETFNPAVPMFPGYRPYEHIVFQYSLFTLADPEAEPDHFECLLTNNSDPAPDIVPHLLNNLSPTGSVVVWNQSFEAQRNKDLAEHCPDYAEALTAINERLFDLMLIFKDGYFVHPAFKGSASLKAVLPVICPNLQYDSLAIRDGTQAMLTWYQFQQGSIPKGEHARIKTEMKNYCKLDTFGMVEIYHQLSKLYKEA